MPVRINGIGTGYAGRANVHRKRGVCPHCGKAVDLLSYDTRLVFTVLFVPVLPLGKRRILDQCPACTKHRAVSSKEWDAARAASLAEVTAAFEANPSNPDAARKALGAAAGFQDERLLASFGPTIRDLHDDDAAVLKLLGAVYEEFSRPAEAEDAYRAAVAASEDDEGRGLLATLLTRRGNPAEAEAFARRSAKIEPGTLWQLVLGYQATGDHSRAIAILDEIATLSPADAKSRDWGRLRKQSERRLASGQPYRHAQLEFANSATARGVPGYAVALLLPVVVGLVFGGFAIASHLASKSAPIYLVNGLDRPYTVSVGGKTIELPPGQPVETRVPEGEVRVDAPDLPLPEAERSVVRRIERDFWERLFVESADVFNPDRVAVIAREHAEYVEVPDPNAPGIPANYHVGEPYYRFPETDYLFEEFPEEVTLRDRKSIVKSRLAVQVVAPTMKLLFAADSEAARAKLIELELAYAPDDPGLIAMAPSFLAEEAYLRIARPRLDARPAAIPWHRVYQEWSAEHHPDHDLEGEYRSALAAAPEDASLLYLLGRVAKNREEGRALFRASAEKDPPCAFGLYALAYEAIRRADFEVGLDMARKALAIEPANSDFANAEWEAMLGAGRYAELIERVRGAGENEYLPLSEDALHCLAGDLDAARAALEKQIAELGGSEVPPEAIERHRTFFSDRWTYIQGDAAAWGELSAKRSAPEDLESDVWTLLALGDVEKAARALEGAEEWSEDWLHTERLVLYMEATRAGKDEIARSALDGAIVELREISRDHGRAAEILAAETPGTIEDLTALGSPPGELRVLLAAFGTRFPERREESHDLARKLNYSPDFPFAELKRILGDGPNSANSGTFASIPTSGGSGEARTRR